MNHINIEIKAKCSDQRRVRRVLLSCNADFKGTDHQIDTYFRIPAGRLKLREGNIENYLVFYDRKNRKGPKKSEVTLVATGRGSEIKELLKNALGVLVVVDKRREIYFIGNIKFHLDEVKGLGKFVEIEAIDTGGIPEKKLRKQCDHYVKILGIRKEEMVSVSYSDLLLKNFPIKNF